MAVKYTAASVIAIATAETGYMEKASNNSAYLQSKTQNAGSANYTKYANYLDNNTTMYNGNKNGYAWCDIFVDWCHVQAAINAGGTWHDAQTALCQPDKGAGAGCTYSMQYYKNKGRFGSTPSVGAQIFFGSGSNSSHTGLVYAFDSNKVYTIEGNTSGSSGEVANGGMVCKKSYARSYGRILGYGYPIYGTATAAEKIDAPSAAASTASVASGMQKYKNGSTEEPVYQTSACSESSRIGTLNAYEECYCFGKVNNGAYLVCYQLDNSEYWKCGYTRYAGGTTF